MKKNNKKWEFDGVIGYNPHTGEKIIIKMKNLKEYWDKKLGEYFKTNK